MTPSVHLRLLDACIWCAAIQFVGQSIEDFHHRQLARFYERALGYVCGLGQQRFGLGHLLSFVFVDARILGAEQRNEYVQGRHS